MATHWSHAIEGILNSTSGDLRKLAQIAGRDPKYFYRNQNLGGCDLRGQDLRGMDLSGCNLEAAIMDGATKVDSIFDPRVEHGDDYWRFQISQELNTMVIHFMRYSNYRYAAWAHRNLVEKAFLMISLNRYYFYHEIIENNKNLLRAVEDFRKVNQVNIRVLLYSESIRRVEQKFERSLTEKDGRWMLAVGLLAHKISFRDHRDFSNLSLNAFYPPSLIKVEGSIS